VSSRISTENEDILTGVLSPWKAAVDAHDPERVASCFTDRPTLTVYLSVLLKRTAEGWSIGHYQVSRLD
jgi:hypothetical protein